MDILMKKRENQFMNKKMDNNNPTICMETH